MSETASTVGIVCVIALLCLASFWFGYLTHWTQMDRINEQMREERRQDEMRCAIEEQTRALNRRSL